MHAILKSLFAATFLISTPVLAQDAADAVAPEVGTAQKAKQDGKPVRGKKWMVAIANPYAAQTAAEVLKEGGTAADAAIAAQLVLGLVEPQSSGLGGGAFLVYFDAKTGKLTTLDGRETAAAAATPRLFQDENGEPLKFFDAVVGGRSVGTPGTPALLADMHSRWGKNRWTDLIAPASKLATDGFTVSPRLEALVERDMERLSVHPVTKNYFLPGGERVRSGDNLKNPAYANTLLQIAESGVEGGFYNGLVAKSIVETVNGFEKNPGPLALSDLANYAVKERSPVCSDFRAMQVCGMGPPSSGALTVGQILGIAGNFDLKALGPTNSESWRIIGDASRLAFADRGRYMADSDFVPMPTKGLIKQDYLSNRADLLDGEDGRAMPKDAVKAGEPSWDHASLQYADDESIELPSTTHFSIIDAEGNAVSMTSTIENGFGSRLMAAGFLLNNEMTDFSFKSHSNGVPIANRVEPGKRPRSSMAPTIVMKDGKPALVIGSPGGSRIIGYVAKTIIAYVDWGMDIQAAISTPHLVNRFGTYDIEQGTDAEKLAPELEKLGYEVKVRDLNSGLHGIAIENGELVGGADPRREGIVLAE